MDAAAETLTAARAAYARRDWVGARASFRAAAQRDPLSPDDAYALANCSWWLGELDDALPVMEAAYRSYLDSGRLGPAALVALDVGYTLVLRGEEAHGSGWLRRAVRHLEQVPEGVEHGYLHHVDFEAAFASGDLDAAYRAADRVRELGERFGDPTLAALGTLGRGRVLIRRGQVADGVALLDEAMVAAVSDELDPGWAGNIYCHLMVACHELSDLRRAGEWTEVTARWCESMPGAGPFQGICRVHRAQVLQVRGEWTEAELELERVHGELGHFALDAVAEAHYLQGEVRRLRGDLAGADAAYRQAHRMGRDPQPGMALLALSRGRADTAAASLRLALAAEQDPLARARLLPAVAEVAVVVGDLDAASRAAEELEGVASTYGTTGLEAAALSTRGAVLLASGDHDAALVRLRRALQAWHALGAPFEVARVRLMLARAYEALGDHDAAALDREVAAVELARLGARSPVDEPPPARSDGLTAREAEVLRLVATGRSNQQIADELVLSVRTVERHLATVYQKLGLHGRNARAAAVSYALRASSDTPAGRSRP